MRPDTYMPEFLPQHDSAPWVPENAPTFKVGDRVRVTAGIAECRLEPDAGSLAADVGMLGHLPSYAGQIATVLFVGLPYPGHPISVHFEQDLECECHPGQKFRQDCFAPSELEPI